MASGNRLHSDGSAERACPCLEANELPDGLKQSGSLGFSPREIQGPRQAPSSLFDYSPIPFLEILAGDKLTADLDIALSPKTATGDSDESPVPQRTMQRISPAASDYLAGGTIGAAD